MNKPATIHVVDDDLSFRSAVTRLLRTQGYEVVAHDSAEAFLSAPLGGRGCILLDVRMPGLSGLQAQEQLATREETLPVVFVTGHGDIPMSVRAIKAGAEDFLTKPVPLKSLVAAIESAMRRHDATLGKHLELKELRARMSQLTPREIEVFDGVVSGRLNREIAVELGAAERTIKAHRHKVMEKMGAASLAELVVMARLLRESA